MGASPDYLIEVGLNIAGFLAAGLLTAIIYSLISDRKKQFKPPILLGASPSSVIALQQSRPNSASIASDIEFIDLSRTEKKMGMTATSLKPRGEYKVRDRREILQQAKKMITQKRDGTVARLSLPVTEGELVFIKQNLNNKEIMRNQ